MPEGVHTIITGGMTGVDTLAASYADKNGIKKVIIHDEAADGKALSDETVRMIERADRVLVFWDGKSKGAKNVYDCAKKTGKPVDMIILKMDYKFS